MARDQQLVSFAKVTPLVVHPSTFVLLYKRLAQGKRISEPENSVEILMEYLRPERHRQFGASSEFPAALQRPRLLPISSPSGQEKRPWGAHVQQDPESIPSLSGAGLRSAPPGTSETGGRLELINNRTELSIRPYVIDQKNFLFANMPSGTTASAVIFTLIQTATETAGPVPLSDQAAGANSHTGRGI